ncbi:MAG: hypothetical protein JWM27_143 [Gemmatimonadetes bacterium]|nr:hypothetical protein [Gemmatimonadota bacterium]
MRKIRLNPDDLHVESFSTLNAEMDGVGTVLGQVKMPPADPATIDPCVVYTQTCGASCNGTCVNTCAGSCYGSCINEYTCAGSCSPLARCVPPAYPA